MGPYRVFNRMPVQTIHACPWQPIFYRVSHYPAIVEGLLSPDHDLEIAREKEMLEQAALH